LNTRESRHLYGLVCQAYQFKDTAYSIDAARAIVDWFESLPARRLVGRQPFDNAALVRLLRVTDPDRIGRRRQP
jgi:hypothetical protein